MDPSTRHERCDWRDAALAGISDAVITIDAAGRVLSINPAGESIFGCMSNTAIGQPLRLILPVIHDEKGDVVEILLGDPQVHTAAIRKQGRAVIIEYRVISMRDGAGAFAGSVMLVRDITRRRTAETALRFSEESLLANEEELFEEKERAQVTLNSIADAVICTDFRGRVSYLNVVAAKLTGWTPEDAAHRALDEVVRLIDATKRTSITCPTTRAIIENTRVDVEGDCVLVRRDGAEIAVEGSAAPIHDKNGGVIGAVLVAHDVTVSRAQSSKLARLALHDTLTDLPNRALFDDRFAEAMASARARDASFALLYVDLDRFKHINDSLGHAAGDALLQLVARRLVGCVRSSDTVSRRGGDEFVILLPDILDGGDAIACADKVRLALNAPYRIGDHNLHVTASIGIAVFPDDAVDAETLLKHADSAMYRAKKSAFNSVLNFKPDVPSAAASG